MRFDRAVLCAALTLFAGCPDEKPAAAPTPRFPGVVSQPAVTAERFCDRTWAAGARAFQMPPTKAFEGAEATPATVVKGWRWVNLWATWCKPCVEEMATLTRWKSALEKDGIDVSFEMVSIDEAEAAATMKTWLGRLPGPLVWVRSPDDVPAWLEGSVGINPDSVIPIHVLVDPSGSQRCVRVGGVHPQDFGAVRAFLGTP